jgi:aldehyde dehydrogenase
VDGDVQPTRLEVEAHLGDQPAAEPLLGLGGEAAAQPVRPAALRVTHVLHLRQQRGQARTQLGEEPLERLDCHPGLELLHQRFVRAGAEAPAHLGGELEGGYYFKPTVFKGRNDMRIFQEEIFGPVLAVTTFKGEEQALQIANDTMYGLGAGVWTRDTSKAFRMGRGIKAGRVWTNCYHLYPAHAAFGGYKVSGVGRENHKMMLDHYSQTKCMLVSYDPKPLGFF